MFQETRHWLNEENTGGSDEEFPKTNCYKFSSPNDAKLAVGMLNDYVTHSHQEHTNSVIRLQNQITKLKQELEGMWEHIRKNEKYIEKLDEILTQEIIRNTPFID
jgi:hypothetical protein